MTNTSDSMFHLWPDGAPDAKGKSGDTLVGMTVYRPDPSLAGRGAMVVCPGGDYRALYLADAVTTAEWLASLGVTAFVLEYRTAPDYQHPAALMDAQRAVKLVRSRAEEFGVTTDRIGMFGTTAGGHLAACAATLFDTGDLEADDPVERHSSRPDALALISPLISMREFCHEPSRDNLLGLSTPEESDVDQALDAMLENVGMAPTAHAINAMSPSEGNALNEIFFDSCSAHRQVGDSSPPTFLAHAADDTTIPCDNSLLYCEALREAGVPVELHLFESGEGGLAPGANDTRPPAWMALCAAWLDRKGFASAR